jgi:hypothetical protein
MTKAALDRVRYYWIFQVAMSFGVAAFFFALVLFFRDLPHDPWQRFFSPILQVPAIASFIVSYLSIFRIKRTYDGDTLMFRYYLWGIGLMSAGLVAALLVATLDKL